MWPRKKVIPPLPGDVLLSALAISTYILLKTNTMNPYTYTGLTVLFFTIFLLTDFRENRPPSIVLHEIRYFEGALILSVPLSYCAYIITLLLNRDSALATASARFAALYVFFICAWLFLSAATVAGPLYAYIGFIYYNPSMLVAYSRELYEQPFILIPSLILVGIFWAFGYIAHLLWLYFVLGGRMEMKDSRSGDMHTNVNSKLPGVAAGDKGTYHAPYSLEIDSSAATVTPKGSEPPDPKGSFIRNLAVIVDISAFNPNKIKAGRKRELVVDPIKIKRMGKKASVLALLEILLGVLILTIWLFHPALPLSVFI